ncbi:MAG: ferritin [Gemmatimonadetes bacterium]|nr:ferritin [Gemmatimonadota bacterium]
MDKKVQQAINQQIGHELESAYLYLAMSAHFETASLPGFARWMRLQAQEELGHAIRLFDYMHDRGGRIELQAIAGPPAEFGDPLSIFEAALKHEQKVTRLIHKLNELAGEKKDTATQVFLQWFITEQVEEEKNASAAVEQLRMAGSAPAALLMLDGRLGARSAAS